MSKNLWEKLAEDNSSLFTDQKARFISNEDALNERYGGEVENVTTGERLTVEEYLEKLKKETKRRAGMPRITNRKIIDIFIFDPDNRVPPDRSLVYEKRGLVTDMDNSGILATLELSSRIIEYNEGKVKMPDEERSRIEGREIKLPKVKGVDELVIRIVEIQ